MKIVTSESLAKSIVDNWDSLYSKLYEVYPDKRLILERLKNLKNKELTPSRVEEIIGNNTWTTTYCDQCETWVNEVIQFKKGCICKDCFREAVSTWARNQ